MVNHKLLFGTCLIAALLTLQICLAGASEEEEKNTAVMKRFYDEIVAKGNIALIDELLAEDFVEHEALPGQPADRNGVKEFFTQFRAAFPDIHFEVKDMVAKGDKVWTYITMHGTHKGEFMGMEPTGKEMAVDGFDLVRFVDGKAVEHWGLTDDMSMMQQLGGMPAEEQSMKQ